MTALKTNTSCTATSTKLKSRLHFFELLGRSNFSFLQGASHPEDLVVEARRLGYQGMALCDLNGLYGVVRAYQAIEFPSRFLAPEEFENRPFSFHCGAEMSLMDGASIALLPMSKEGYAHLCQIITLSKRQSEKTFSNLTLDTLELYADELLAFALPPWSEERLQRLRELFWDRLYLPVWKDFSWQSLQLYNQALKLEEQGGFELFATNRPLMATREAKHVHDVLTCILHKTSLKEARTRLLSNGERHLKTLEELEDVWKDRPDLLAKTSFIAKRLNFSLSELRYEYPEITKPPGMDATQYLSQLVEVGLKRRYSKGINQTVRQTVQHELDLIRELRYEEYFLTLWDICQFAVQQGILHQGRGSAANSIVCYALGLTSVDPTKVQLLFERFISRERGEPPDIDIDFESGRREEVIQYIYKKYGAEHAAMVCTVVCYRTRMAVREVGKVLQIPMATIDKVVKYMGREGLSRLQEAPEKAAEWKLTPQIYQLLIRLSSELKGFPRHLGIHTGGFLIAKRPITQCVPVEKATMDQRYVIQWNKDDLTVLKMLKIDVLGLGMLTALQKCFELLKQIGRDDLELYSLPYDDPKTYKMIQKADTVGTFQIESRAQMSLLPRLRPENFYDLVIEVAIVRPGPIQGGMVHPFVRRKHGQETITYAHPDLEPILKKTCGVPIFQEQIMQIASTVAGFTPGEADELRRIMSSSWKKHDLMHGLKTRLIAGMLQHGIDLPYAEQIYQTIVGFASYGFPESHAASFAILTYASCYLKCHHPDIFTCSLLNSQPMGFYSPRSLIQDAQRHQVKFLDLDIQKSDWDYTIDTSNPASVPQPVRVGFRAIAGLNKDSILKMLEERRQNGPYQDLADLVRRTQLPKPALMKLAAAGSFNSLGLSPRQTLWTIQGLTLDSQSLLFAQEATASGQEDLKHLPAESAWQNMCREYQSQGFSTLLHPIGVLRPTLEKWSQEARHNNTIGYTRADRLTYLKNNSKVRVAGLMSMQQRPPTAKGFAFLTLEDESGLINVVLYPKIYQRFRLVILQHPLLSISGVLQNVEGVIHVKAEQISPLLKVEPPIPTTPIDV